MCGIIGIYNQKDIAPEIWLGLIALQHRGQDAAGIVTYERGSTSEGRFYLKKGKGTVQSLFKSEDIQRLKGSIGIGHVRYPTIGAGDPEDAQPFYTNSPFGIAMAHNGNVINYAELKDLLVNKYHRHINTENDVELLLNLLAAQIGEISGFMGRDKRGLLLPLIIEAVSKLMEKVNGSYSCVCFIAGKGLLGFRDPYGIKPLKFGIAEKGVCFASESVALDILGYKEMRDVLPGEAIFVDTKRKVHSVVIKPQKIPKHCIFEYIYFARPDSVMDDMSVYEARFKLGQELAKSIKERGIKPDVVIPIPDTARTTAVGIAETLGVRNSEGLIKNRYIGRTFIMPRDEKRMEWVKYKLN
ncbi:MAG: amidophosphoribosyltransferase, partial [Candidatus Stahlbacteria bacterium]|nr:amidophosphoribosyltransferase [Candidatus Stahlbacteria bacterium]